MKHAHTLGEILVNAGLIQEDGYARALEIQAREGFTRRMSSAQE